MNSFPNIIHQIWLQGENNIPNEFQINMEQNKKLHKTWTYILWDDIKIINLMRKDKTLIDTYYTLEYLHLKVDFARYVIIYIYGGVYIDMDAKCQKSLDPLLKQYEEYDLILSKVNCNLLECYINCRNKTCLNNGIIISKKNNIIMKKMIDYVLGHPHCSFLSTKITCIQNITGPKRLTDIVYKNINDKVKLLDYDYLEPCNIDKCNITENTYVVHKHNISWIPNFLKRIFKFYVHNKMLIYSLIFTIFILLIIFIYYLFRLYKRSIKN